MVFYSHQSLLLLHSVVAGMLTGIMTFLLTLQYHNLPLWSYGYARSPIRD